MKQDLIKDVVQGMLPYLNTAQSEKLQEVLSYALAKYEVTENQNRENNSEQNYIELFLAAKRIEGCSEKSLKYYKATGKSLTELRKKKPKGEGGRFTEERLQAIWAGTITIALTFTWYRKSCDGNGRNS